MHFWVIRLEYEIVLVFVRRFIINVFLAGFGYISDFTLKGLLIIGEPVTFFKSSVQEMSATHKSAASVLTAWGTLAPTL